MPASGELTQLFSNVVQSAGQAVEQAAEQLTGLARYPSDFDMFPDLSKQVQRNFTEAEVKQCSGQNDGCLLVLYGDSVLNLTVFAPYHYGGSDVLRSYAGEDASAAMLASGMPTYVFDTLLQRFVVGTLV